MIEFTKADYIQVLLTVHGKGLHRQRYETLRILNPWLPKYDPILEDEQGWSTWQFGEFLIQFGQLLNGDDHPTIMQNVIRLPEKGD